MALALLVLRIDKLAAVMPMRSLSSLRLIFRFAIMTSKLTIIDIAHLLYGQVVVLFIFHGFLKDVSENERQKHRNKKDKERQHGHKCIDDKHFDDKKDAKNACGNGHTAQCRNVAIYEGVGFFQREKHDAQFAQDKE